MPSISYQLYSSRNFGPLDATFKMLAELGYTQAEAFGGLLEDPNELIAASKAHGIAIPTCHVGLEQLEADPAGMVDLARTLGVKAAFVPYLDAADRPTDAAGWAAFAKRVYDAGAPLRDAGITFGWHNHDFEFVAGSDGVLPIDAMLDGAPDLGVELDIAWVVRGGGDPVAWIEKLGDRISAVHVKDIAPTGECEDEDGWADVGHGTMDWGPINAALAKTSVQYAVMEHDNPNDDQRFASRSYATASAF